MTFFRSHIIRMSGVLSLLAGIVFCYFSPSDEYARHEAFASWLESQLKTSQEVDAPLRSQIQALSFEDGELDRVIQKASELVQNHSDDFELPLNKQPENPEEIFHLLVQSWNSYQHASDGMGNAVLIKPAKTHSVLPNDSFSAASKLHKQHSEEQQLLSYHRPLSIPEDVSHTLSPLSGGIAIGAP